MHAREGNPDQTRERILDEAERLFAERGFDAVSVRQITSAAHTNLAAVNYHFGGKENLYLEVFRQRWMPRARRVFDRLEALEAKPDVEPDQVVGMMVEAFLVGLDDQEERRRHSLLIMREVTKPGPAFEMVTQEVERPFVDRTRRLLASHLPGADQERLTLYVLSIFFQSLHFSFARNLVMKATGQIYDAAFLGRLTDHLVDFSLHGLDGSRPPEKIS
ncbi:MAG: CerR family C-terminal domain-containing protein [Pseudomonadota bacterium]